MIGSHAVLNTDLSPGDRPCTSDASLRNSTVPDTPPAEECAEAAAPVPEAAAPVSQAAPVSEAAQTDALLATLVTPAADLENEVEGGLPPSSRAPSANGAVAGSGRGRLSRGAKSDAGAPCQ